jgi:GntR family transcriptional regulator/MocR family aminotransferase
MPTIFWCVRSRYYLTEERKKGLLMGFASLAEAQMEPAFRILLACLQTLCPQVLAEKADAEKQNAPT